MKVFLIGGTGLMGPHVALRLKTAGVEVVLFNRRGLSLNSLPVIQGDRRDHTSLQQALRTIRPDVVVDMSAFTRTDAEGLLEACRGLGSAIVVASSIDVFLAYGRLHRTEAGPICSQPIDETSSLRTKLTTEGITYDKLGVETVLSNQQVNPTTILRFPMIYGRPDTNRIAWAVQRMLDQRRYILIESGYAAWRVSRAFTRNCAEAVVLCVLNSAAEHRVFNVAEPFAYSECEWTERIGVALGWKGQILARKDARLPVPFGIDPRQDMMIDSTRIRSVLGYEEVVSPNLALQETVVWAKEAYRAGRLHQTVDYRLEDEVYADHVIRPLTE